MYDSARMSSRSPCLALALVACAATLVSCTNVLGIEETKYEVPAAPANEDWSCVGTPAPVASSSTIKLSVKTEEFLAPTSVAVPFIEVRACSLYDTACDSTKAIGSTDAQGVFATNDLAVSVLDQGYLQFTDLQGNYKTLKWVFSQPPTKDFELVVKMAGKNDLTTIAGGLDAPGGGKLTYNEQKGVLTFSVVTCATDPKGGPVPAANVAVNATPRNADAAGYYAGAKGGFSLDTTQKTTTEAGRGAIFNLDPASVTITVTHGSREVATIQSVPVVADTITTIDMFPDRI